VDAFRRLYKHNERRLPAAMCRAAMRLQADAVPITAYSCMPPLAQSEGDQRIRYDNEPWISHDHTPHLFLSPGPCWHFRSLVWHW